MVTVVIYPPPVALLGPVVADDTCTEHFISSFRREIAGPISSTLFSVLPPTAPCSATILAFGGLLY